jgi:hypothetical protein
MHVESIRRSGARRPVIVGDRLDTDVEAGFRACTPTLLVLTGVTTLDDLLAAPARHRPSYLARDLLGLLRPHPAARLAAERTAGSPGPTVGVCGRWAAVVDDGKLSWRPADDPGIGLSGGGPRGNGTGGAPVPDDGLDAARAACVTAWSVVDAGGSAPTLPPLPS